MNLKLELLNYFDLTRCLCEIKTDSEGLAAPKEYISEGNFDAINFDAFDGVSYWRLRDEITTTPLDNVYKAGKRIQTTVPLKLVFSIRRDKLSEDDAYSYDRIRQTIVKQFNFDDGALKTSLGSEKVIISSPTANGNPKEVWDEETENTGTFEPKYEVVFGSVDIDVVITSKGECLPTECDDVDSDILHTFDFCSSAVRGRLTPEQVVCLQDAYGGACLPATLTVNGGVFTTVDSGDTLDIEVHDTADNNVGTVVSTSEIEIADNDIEFNGSSVDSVKAEETYSFIVELDSVQSGTYNAATNTVSVTSAACADATTQVNAVNVGTVASGGTFDQQIHDSAGADVGTAANPSVVGDATVTVNGDSLGATGSVVAEGSVDLVVNLDGSPSGSWDGDSWEVTSAACADATVNVNGVFMENIPSGDTENIEVRQETGATLVGSKQGQYWRVDDSTVQNNATPTWIADIAAEETLTLSQAKALDSDGATTLLADYIPSADGFMFTCTPGGGSCPSVSLAVSDTAPAFGDTITLTATPTDITPVTYFFFAYRESTSEFLLLQESASNTYAWTVDKVDDWVVHVLAEDALMVRASDCEAVTIAPDADAEAWLDFVAIPNDTTVYFSNTPQEVTGAQYWYYVNALVFGLKADGLWSSGHYGYLFIGGASAIHKINLFNPADTDSAFRLDFNGGWTHDVNGITANGTNTYADTHFDSSVHLAANDGAFVVYTRVSQTGAVIGFDWGAFETSTNKAATWAAKVTANRSFYAMGVTKQVNSIAVSDLTGCHILTRDNNSALQKWIGNDGTVLNSDTTANIGHPPYSECIGARNDNGTAILYAESGTNYSLMGRFDGLSDSQATSLRGRIDTLMEQLNLNV